MINKKNLLAIAILMCVTFIPADASSLVRMDIKKTSDSAVDVTFYTTETNGNPIVTRKSNNKYVVLMPNVASGSLSLPDLSDVKDMITDVNIKNVDDGMSGYTKVTFITTKPVNIKTHSQKSAPLTQEEKQAKAVIAQVKTNAPQPAAKTESKSEKPKPVTEKTKVQQTVKQSQAVTQNVKKSENLQKKIETSPENYANNAKSEENKISKSVSQEIPELNKNATPIVSRFDIKEVEKIEKIAKSKTSKFREKHQKSSKAGWAYVLLPLAILYMISRMIRTSIQRSNALRLSFAENLAERPYKRENYDDIINDTELNWKEKYQKFVQESNGNVKNRQYTFIKMENKPDVSVNNQAESEKFVSQPEKIQKSSKEEIDKKRAEFERTLSKTPEIYKPLKLEVEEEKVPEVKSEDDAIQKQLKEVKLTAFAKPISLHTSQRRRLQKVLPEEKHFTEGKFVKLEKSLLNTTYRKFTTGNLKVSDLVKTGNRYIPESDRDDKSFEDNYLISSVDEYFALLDKEQARKMTIPVDNLSQKVAQSLAQVKPSMKLNKSRQRQLSRTSSNPFENKSSNDNYMNGLIVKSGYNIDEEKGFYLVSLDGVTALVGRVKDEIFVFKKFDDNVDNLQVRLDNENVYMVKAGDFKSLIDVSENNMGVLIEL